MKRNTSKLIVICLMTLMLSAALAGCGSKKGVDGYYIYEKQQGQIYALEISGDTAALYYSVAGGHTIEASVDKTDEGADLYFGESPSTFLNEWNDFNPMHVKISDDSKKMYLTSDSSGWSALTFEVVSKKEFDEAIGNASTVTQGEQDQPSNSPDNSAQLAESTNTSENEPQNGAGELPEGGFYLYDGVHYLSVVGESDIISTVISGGKIANATHEIFVEQAESNTGRVCGTMSVILGQNEEPFNYQISYASETEYNRIGQTVAPGETDTFVIADAFAWVINPTAEEKIVVDCPIFLFTIDNMFGDDTKREKTLDGKSFANLNDLINILGTPTAAFCINGELSLVYYIWQSEDFIYTAGIRCEFEEIFDEERQTVYFDVNWDNTEVASLSYYALNYGIDENALQSFDPRFAAWPVQALTDLGLL